ncbi:MAG TPA: MarR family winged helix-turn-helix transcriptional regulator [Solirubrobacteraceae bacterium]|nr:MarR family winged helix-turn-helix transcriptional regulator [Solirubrobacteraceae bacterium]
MDAPGPPTTTPIGLRLTRTARVVSLAFDRAMAEAGGSASIWQVLVIVRAQRWGTQAAMAEEMGITGATLTHHLNMLENRGLVRRWRDPGNRRVQNVELTEDGVELFDRLRVVAQAHDRRLRAGLSEDEVTRLGELLDRLEAGVSDAG